MYPRGIALLAVAVFATGCAASADHTDASITLRAPKGAAPSTTTARPPAGFTVTGGDSLGECSYAHEQALLVGVQDDGPAPATLWMFDPSPSTDEAVPPHHEYWGELKGCPVADPSKGVWPTALSLDWNGTAYVMWTFGLGTKGTSVSRLYKFDPWGAATCEPVGLDLKGPSGKAFRGGMGFSVRERAGEADWLFFAGRVDGDTVNHLSAWDPVGNTSRVFDGVFPTGFTPDRVAGTEDGLLFAFDGPRFVEIDPNDGSLGAVRSMKIPGHHFPGSGFAFLQDDLWAFESSGSVAASTSVVHRFDRKSGETFEETTVPVHVAAAAPMTCAPGTAK